MGNNLSFRKIWSVCRTEYVKWVMNARMIMFVALIVFVYDYVIRTIMENGEKMGEPINIIEPFIAIGNSALLLFIMPIVFLALISDFPKSDGNSMFYMIRTGKVNWFLGQTLFAIVAGISYVGAILGISCLVVMKNAFIYNEWSDVVYLYYKYFPNDYDNVILDLITDRLYNNLTPLQAFTHTALLMLLMVIMTALIQLLSFAYNRKMVGLLINICLLCMGIGTTLFEGSLKWVFPVSNAVAWMHYDRVFKKPIVPIINSYLYFIIIIVVLLVWNIIAIKKYDFSKVRDLED